MTTPEPAASLARYFGLHRAPAMVLAALYAAGGQTVSRLDLQSSAGIARATLASSAALLHSTLPNGSLYCIVKGGYRLADVGLDACAFALAEVATWPAPEAPVAVRKPIVPKPDALWSDDGRLKMLQHGVARGIAFSQLARQIGHGCTRSGAIGKAARMGWKQPGKPAKPSLAFSNRHRAGGSTFGFKPAKVAEVAPKPKPAAPRLVPAGNNTVILCPAAPPSPFIVPERNEAPGTATVLTLGAHMCKWPIGDPSLETFTFCGDQADDGPYCLKHAAIAYQPTAEKQRRDAEIKHAVRRYG